MKRYKSLYCESINNLQWGKSSTPKSYTYDEAVKYSSSLGEGWRLPTIDEILELYKTNKSIIASNSVYWTSSNYNLPNNHKYVFYNVGSHSYKTISNENKKHEIICVKGESDLIEPEKETVRSIKKFKCDFKPYTYNQALNICKQYSKDTGDRWVLPSIKELEYLKKKGVFDNKIRSTDAFRSSTLIDDSTICFYPSSEDFFVLSKVIKTFVLLVVYN